MSSLSHHNKTPADSHNNADKLIEENTKLQEEIKHLNFLLKKTREQLNLANNAEEKAEARAEETEIYLQNVVKNTTEHLYWMDKQGIILGCNEKQAQSFGFKDSSQLIGKNLYELLVEFGWDKDLIENLRTTNLNVMRTGKPEEKEEVGFFKGETHTFLSKKSPLKNKQSEIIGVFGFSTDITYRKKAEAAMLDAVRQAEVERIESEFKKILDPYKRSQEEVKLLKQKTDNLEIYLNTFLKHAPGNFYWVDKKGELLGCNDRQANIFGFEKAEDFVGKNIYDMLYGMKWESKYVEALRVNNLAVMNSGEMQETEERGIFDGEERTFLSYKIPMRDKENKVIGIFGFSVDITERKKAEMAMWAAKEQAEKASKAKTDFLENMRHDLRTPFSAVIGIAQGLMIKEKDPEKKESLGWILQSSNLVLNVLNDILASANADTIKTSTYEIFSIRELASDLNSLFAAEVHLKKLAFDVEIHENVPKLLAGDKLRTQRILMNLLSNAVKFTSKGKIKLEILAEDTTKEGLNLIIIVSDTGEGIPEDKLPHIFEKFIKLTPSYLSNSYTGVGVGLSIVQQLVKDLKGTIKVRSKEGEGTTFTCVLPFDLPD